MRKGVRNGTVHGILAFDDKIPVGWCTFGPVILFPGLTVRRTLRCNDSSRVWSLPCFFVPRAYRGKGVASALLSHALRDHEKAKESRSPKDIRQSRTRTADTLPAFSWTGTRSMFKNAGFSVAGNPDGSKQRVRKILKLKTRQQERQPKRSAIKRGSNGTTNIRQTGLKVSVLGFGAGHIGSEDFPEKEVESLLHQVLDSGITLIDTARAYGFRKRESENILAADETSSSFRQKSATASRGLKTGRMIACVPASIRHFAC